jgi:small subunit ribosomal protein S28e
MGGGKTQRVREVNNEPTTTIKSSSKFSSEGPVRAEVVRLILRTGARGEITQVECKILEGKKKDDIMRRNVKGPVRLGDLLTLRETEIEARRVKGATKGAHA